MKTKQLFITLLFITFSLFAKAQEKYEFMIIEFNSVGKLVSISIDGKEFLKEKAEYGNQEKNTYNANPLLYKVNFYQEKGWEVMNFSSVVVGAEMHFAYLRKKK